jgi:hypothetical protein
MTMPGQNTHTTSVIERFGGDISKKTLKKVGEESEEEYDEEVEEEYDEEEEEEGEATLRTERTTNSNLKQKNFTSSSVAVIETTKEEPVFVGV